MKKKLISLLTALSMTLMLFLTPNIAEAALSTSVTGGCDGNHTDMTAWTGGSFSTSGSYYLTDNVALTSEIRINTGDNITLCLNGCTINAGDNCRIFKVDRNNSLTLCDCKSGGKLTGGKGTEYGGAVYVDTKGSFTMYGGEISGNNATRDGGAVYVDGSFTMCGGEISGNYADNGGGGVYNRGTFTMSGDSTISGNEANSGGGVVVQGYSANFIMSGGMIGGTDENSANKAKYGSGVHVAPSGKFKMSGGTILSNEASDYGGGVYLNSNGTFEMSGGSIISGNNGSNGGGVYVTGSSTFKMSGDSVISDNKASSSGGGVYLYNNSTFEMTGGKISKNEANDGNSSGGGVYVSSSIFTMSGDSIISGNNGSDGGGVYMTGSGTTFTMSGGTISGNTAKSKGGGVNVSNGTFKIYGNVDIIGNSQTDDNSANNVFLNTNKTITIESGFNANSQIGVNTSTAPTCTNFVDVTGAAEDISGSFTADIDGQSIVYDDGIKLSGAHGTNITHTGEKLATCTADGNVEYWYCSKCKKYFSDSEYKNETTLDATVINKTNHSYGSWNIKNAPTLTETGTAERVCANNSSHIETKDVPVLSANDWTKSDTSTDPKPNENGEYVYTSEDYGTVTVDVPKLNDPVWTKTVTKEPTVKDEGSYTYTSDYGTVPVTVPELTDSKWTKTVKEPTVKEDGEYTYESEYGEIKVTVPKLTDSKWTKNVIQNPTVKEDGSYTYTSEDYDTVTVTVPKLTDSVWEKDETTKPTIDGNGKYTYTSDYGTVTADVPKLTDTSVWEKTETTNPTIDGNGLYTYTSEDYGDITVTVPKLSDNTVWTKDDSQHFDPTEEETGKDVYTSKYGEVEVELPAKEHNHTYSEEWSNDGTHHWHSAICVHTDEIKDKDLHKGGTATCSAKAVCEVCGKEYGELNSNNHNFADGKCDDCQAVDPSHTHKGGTATCEKKAVCEICKQEYGELAKHSFTDGACENCGAADPSYVPPHNHTFVNGKCECGEIDPNYVPSHNHTFVDGKCECGETDPSYVPPHNHTFVDGKCECGETDPNYVPPHNHTFVDGKCECGETDPSYVPPHNHNFVDGKCECGETDPSYVPPHNHTFVDGKCECGETDPNYVPPHNHTFVDGKCECGETDPNYVPSGRVTEDVHDTAGTNAELTKNSMLIENVLTSEDRTAVENGSSFEIILEVTDIRNSVSPADVTAASSVLKSGGEIGVYVDLSLFKIKDGTERIPIHNANGQIGITLTVPESIFAGDRTYSMIRVHDGTAENLGGTYDKANRSLTFYTDKFSTYAIAFTASSVNIDSPTVPTTPSNPSKPSSGSSSSSGSSVSAGTPTVTEAAKTEEEIISDDEPYIEDVSSGAEIYEIDEADNNIHYVLIVIFAAFAGISTIAAKKRFRKKNIK